jgi:hypothetical protein
MNQHSDIERVLTTWFDDGPSRMPDRVIDVVADRISWETQRRPWRLRWRLTPMTTPLKLATAAVAIAVIAILGYNLLPAGHSGIGGPSATPSASGTPTPMPTPSAPPLPAGSLHAQDYVARALPDDPMAFTVTAPEGWNGFGGWAMNGPKSYSAPDGVGVAFLHGPLVTADPCDPATREPSPAPSSPSVPDLVAYLSARGDLEVSGVTDVELAGWSGKRLDIQFPDELACVEQYVFAEPQGFYAQGAANHWRVWIVDTRGETAVVVLSDYAATPVEDRAAAQAAIDSVRITP